MPQIVGDETEPSSSLFLSMAALRGLLDTLNAAF